jgi:hypothetical protein
VDVVATYEGGEMKIPFAQLEKFVIPEKEEGRTPMKSLWLDVEGERLLATDGHLAIRQTVIIEDGDISGLIPVEAFDLARKELKAIAKATKDELPDPWLRVTCGEDAVVIQNLMTNTTHLVTRSKLDANSKFPNVDAVFPKLAKKPSVTLSANLLATVIKAVGIEGDGLSIWVDSNEKPVMVAASNGKAIAAVMPMRGEPDMDEVNKRGIASRNELAEAKPASAEAQ